MPLVVVCILSETTHCLDFKQSFFQNLFSRKNWKVSEKRNQQYLATSTLFTSDNKVM